MTDPIDVLQRGRKLADDMLAESATGYDAETVRLLCDEIAAHRLARDTNAPGVAERLTRYREAAPTAIAPPRDYADGTIRQHAETCERWAHAMLRAEREPDR